MNSNNKFAQAEYNFDATYADELTLKCGDIIQILYEIDQDWVYAKSPIDSSYAGIVPFSYLKLIYIPESIPTHDEASNNSNPMLYLSVSDFDLIEEGDLDFKKGEVLVGLQSVDKNWSKGYCLQNPSKQGIIPMTHVIKIHLSSQTTVNQPQVNQANIQGENISFNVTPKTVSLSANEENLNLRQAKAVYDFDNTSYVNDSTYNYLKIRVGDYLLITKKLDDNWLQGENSSGERGLFPFNCVELIQDRNTNSSPNPILNRTQRQFTVVQESQDHTLPKIFETVSRNLHDAYISHPSSSFDSHNINQDSDSFKEEENLFKSDSCLSFNSFLEDQDKYANEIKHVEINGDAQLYKYCRVNFNFLPENINELGCFSGEFLKINSKMSEDWMECSNYYNKTGLVPCNFVTFLEDEDQFARELFENQTKNKSTNTLNATNPPLFGQVIDAKPTVKLQLDLVSPIQQSASDKSYFNNKTSVKPTHLNIDVDNKYELSSTGGQLIKFKDSNNPFSLRTRSLTPVSANESLKKINVVKPPIPPKPKKLQNLPNTGISELVMFRPAGSKPIRPPSVNSSSQTSRVLPDGFLKTAYTTEERQTKRKFIITELVDTERTYCSEIRTCYDAFMNESLILIDSAKVLKTPPDFDNNLLFDNLKPVIDISRHLLDLIDSELAKNSNKIDQIDIASCLISCFDDMKMIYAKYTRNHNNVSNLIKKYESIPITNDYIKERMNSLRDSQSVFSLSTLLIKPVQRIFKYPLFLNRLIETSDDSEADYLSLKSALKISTEMLEFINEYKRRKDLINKYLSLSEQNDQSITEKVKKLNMHTLIKKSNRLRMGLSSMLGLMTKRVSDDQFGKIEFNYRTIEKSVRAFHTDIEGYLVAFKDTLDCEKNIFTTLLTIFKDDEFKTFSKFDSTANTIRSVKYHTFASKAMKYVLTPLITLLACFNGPNKLIEKRQHKLLDYEAAISDVELKTSTTSVKELEKNLEIAKKDYEALNYQLIEELPLLTSNATRVIQSNLKCYVRLTKSFLQLIKQNFDENIEFTCINLSMVAQESTQSQRAFVLSKIENINTVMNRQSVQIPTETIQQLSKTQTDEQRQKLVAKYTKEKLYIVAQRYLANEKLCQLNQGINDLVGLVKSYDFNNQTHMWFMDNGETEGFIPAEALIPYKLHIDNIDLIDLNDEEKRMKRENSLKESNIEFFNSLFVLEEKKEFCIAMYNFKAIAANMINLFEGEIYRVIDRFDKKGNPDWWLVEINSERGYVPSNYVKLLD